MLDKQLRSLVKSFAYAFRGLWQAICTQRNMRIHFTAAFVVLWLSYYFNFTSGEYVSLMVTIGMVISAELFNTAIEAVVDRQGREFDMYARIAKDTASAAVLVSAFVSLGVAVVLFVKKPQGFVNFFEAYFSSSLGVLIVSFAAIFFTVFIFVSPSRMLCKFKASKTKLSEKNEFYN